jgi:hypothetical protein
MIMNKTIINKWEKQGVIFNPDNLNDWIYSHAYIPTPYLLNDETIRVFVAFKDLNGVGRIGYVDVSAKNPFETISVSKTPSLDIGVPGAFDDNGVTPISIVNNNGKLYLYYAGWQLSDKVRYFLFAGLAISDDMGVSFKRAQKVPILERTDQEFLLRSAPMVIKQEKKWLMIYAGGGENVLINNNITPSYSLKYLASEDGLNWIGDPIEVLAPKQGLEFGFGRPFCMYDDGKYKIWYSIRGLDESYKLGYAESSNLVVWSRLDYQLEEFIETTGSYDNKMQVFAAVIKTKYGNYMFYNGNDYGKTGICFAIQK